MQRIVLSRVGKGPVLTIPIEESPLAAEFVTERMAPGIDRRYSIALQESAEGQIWTTVRSAAGQGGADDGD